MRIIHENTPHLHIYKQDWVNLDGKDHMMQQRKPRKTPVIKIKQLLFSDGYADLKTSDSDKATTENADADRDTEQQSFSDTSCKEENDAETHNEIARIVDKLVPGNTDDNQSSGAEEKENTEEESQPDMSEEENNNNDNKDKHDSKI